MHLYQKTILFLTAATLIVACEKAVEPPAAPPIPPIEYPELFDLSINHDGVEREYLLYVPEGYDETVSWPLVINMHGLGSDRYQQMVYSNFNSLADEYKFIVVYPQGLVAQQNGQSSTHWNADFGTGVDDVGFIDNMIEEIYLEFNINYAKVYSTGMSNGGFMSYTLACSLSDRIAAIASVTGSMTTIGIQNCDPGRQIPVMEFHGTADDVVPYDGVIGAIIPIPEVVNFWVANNGCSSSDFLEELLPDIDEADSSTVVQYTYNICNEGSEVIHYKIDNGGHTWPGSFNVPALGNTNQDIDASLLIWEFFSQYTHPSPRKPNS